MRPRFISIPTFRHFFEWLKSRLDEKANAEHEHAEYPTRFEMQTAVQSVADPVIVLTEAEFAAIVPDATKIYVIY